MTTHLGPFQGITDVWFRQIFAQHFEGVDKFYTPFFGSIHSSTSRHFRSDELDPRLNEEQNLVPQLLTNQAGELERFAIQCHTLGYNEININMGCPWPQVSSKKRGCGLMPHPSMVAELLQPVRNLPVKVSVKCRLGLHDASELSALMPVFEQSGISTLIVHARTGVQLYKGKAFPEVLSRMLGETRIPIVYNGDIFQPDDLKYLNELFPKLEGIMLGRGLLADPFLAGDIKGSTKYPGMDQRLLAVRKFTETLYLRRTARRSRLQAIPGPMKELWWYLSRSFDQPAEVWRLIRKARTADSFLEAQAVIFRQFAWLGRGFARCSSDMIEQKQQE
ncbi:MAG: tRNA-dihydrouridine synthase family protein [Bacteroidetes bacterium]|nr:tRNA-dihydrouridine synthase family protein [Bacteroidota bacterium]